MSLSRVCSPAFVLFVVFWMSVRSARSDEFMAFTEPYRDIEIAASETGTLAQLHVKEGDLVVAGQVIASLDDEVFQAMLRVAEAHARSEAKVRSAEAEVRLHSERLKKLEELRDRNHASQQEVARTSAQVEIATENLQAARDEHHVKTLDVQRIQAQIDNRRVKSPIDGIVTVVHKDVGEFVSIQEPAVAKVVQVDNLLVVFSAPLAAQDVLKPEDQVAVKLGGDRDNVVGIIEYVSPTIDAQSGTVRVRIRVPNPDRKIRSGATCRVELPGVTASDEESSTPTRMTSFEASTDREGRAAGRP